MTPAGRNPIPRALDAVAVLAILCGLVTACAGLWDLSHGGEDRKSVV